MSTTLIIGPFLVSHSFLLLALFPQNPFADFPLWVVLREPTFNLSSFKASKPYLFRLSFWLSFFLSFFPRKPNPFLTGWKFSQLLPFMVLLSRFLEVPAPCSWIVTLQAFWFLFPSLGDWEGHIFSSFLVFLGALFELSQSHPSCAARPKDSEPLVASGYPSPVLPTRLPLIFWSWQAELFPFFPSFHGL